VTGQHHQQDRVCRERLGRAPCDNGMIFVVSYASKAA
jgi:hypothetical protein